MNFAAWRQRVTTMRAATQVLYALRIVLVTVPRVSRSVLTRLQFGRVSYF